MAVKLPVTMHGPTGKAEMPGMLMVHGWPDDERLFSAQVAHFSTRYRIACVRLPWFSTRDVAYSGGRDGRRYNTWGYDFDALAEGVVAAARDLGAGRDGRKIVLVGHDWGAVIAFLAELQNPGLFSRVVAMDVTLSRWMISGPNRSSGEVKGMLFAGLAYQFVLILAFILSLIPGLAGAGNTLASLMARKLKERLLWSRVSGPDHEAVRAESPAEVGIAAQSGYMYFYLWRAYVRGFLGWYVNDRRRYLVATKARLQADPRAYPSCPVLFLYGAAKNYSFHDPRWLESVGKRTDGSRVVACEGSDHWLLVEESDKVNKEMDCFLTEQ